MIKKILCVVIAAAFLALTLFFGAASKENSLAKLDEQQQYGMEIAAAAATASFTVALVPDDSTTPIADQIANVASYLVIANVAILLEKFIVNVAPEFSGICAGAALLLFVVGLFTKGTPRLREVAARLLVFAMCFMLIVPLSLWLDAKIDRTLGTAELMDSITESETETEEQTEEGSLWSRITGAVNDLTESVTNAAQAAMEKLNAFIKAVAALLLTTCVVPIITMLLLFGVCKWTVRGLMEILVQTGILPKEEKPLPQGR